MTRLLTFYQVNFDQEATTDYQTLLPNSSNEDDESSDGELHLFNPSSTTYAKNWYSTLNMYGNTSYTSEKFAAGYFNIASALTQIQFKMSGGNMNGTIMMYGVL